MVSSKGGKAGFVFQSRQEAHKALRKRGMTKKVAAMIANRGDTHGERSTMAKKAARTRKRKGK